MAETTDGWDLAGSFRMARVPHGWTTVGGDEDDESVTLNVVVQHPTDDELVKRYEVRMKIATDAGGDLTVSAPTVSRI